MSNKFKNIGLFLVILALQLFWVFYNKYFVTIFWPLFGDSLAGDTGISKTGLSLSDFISGDGLYIFLVTILFFMALDIYLIGRVIKNKPIYWTEVEQTKNNLESKGKTFSSNPVISIALLVIIILIFVYLFSSVL